MTVTSIALPPIRGEPDQLRMIDLDWKNMPRRWVFFDIKGQGATKSLTRELNEYAFTHILYDELMTGQDFLSPLTSSDPGPGVNLKRHGSYTLVFANVNENYPVIAGFSTAYSGGLGIQLVTVDQVEGGNRSSQALAVQGNIFVFSYTGNYALVRISLTAFCISYRVFKRQSDGKTSPLGVLDGGAYDFTNCSFDTAQAPLSKLIEDNKKALQKGLSAPS